MANLSEHEIQRRESLEELISLGIDPYPAESFEVNTTSKNILQHYSESIDDDGWKQVSIAGRLMSKRIMGNASFAVLQDSEGRIQLYISRDELCPGEDKPYYNSDKKISLTNKGKLLADRIILELMEHEG